VLVLKFTLRVLSLVARVVELMIKSKKYRHGAMLLLSTANGRVGIVYSHPA
jgi:hypothetical protein